MVPAGFFRVSLPDKAIFIKILITNGKQLRLKQSSSPIHIVLQHPMPESRKLPAAQYDTIHHGAKHPAVRHQPPSAIRRQGRSARTSAATRKYGWHGASRSFTMICPHASPVPFTSIWKPYSTIRPITGIATRSWGLLRSSRSASARYAGSMAGKRRYSSTGTPRNTTGKHFVGIPPQGSRHSTTGYLNYRQVVQGIPTVGSSCTTQWYVPYLSKVLLVPNCGTDSTKQRNLLVHAYN